MLQPCGFAAYWRGRSPHVQTSERGIVWARIGPETGAPRAILGPLPRYAERMAERLPRAIVCTLDVSARRNREDEFRALFAEALERVERPHARAATLVLDATREADVRDLFAREQRCCAFFEFAIARVDHTVVVDVGVPEDAEQALDFLLALAPPGQAAGV